jgi:hypothetical protein
VEPKEIKRYGCAKPERISDNLVQILDIVEKPEPASAPSNLAVMGRYIFTPEIFDKLEQVEPGVGGEIQLTDAIAMLLADQAVYGATFDGGRFDTGTVPAYLETIVELALGRPDLGPAFGRFLADMCQSPGPPRLILTTCPRDLASPRRATTSWPGALPAPLSPWPSTMRSGASWRATSWPGSWCRLGPTRRWTASQSVRSMSLRHPKAVRWRCRSSPPSLPARRPTRRSVPVRRSGS